MKPTQNQIGGNHYSDMLIQPAEYCELNNLSFLEGNVIKYISRHRNKNGAEDLKKAQHCIDLLLEMHYNAAAPAPLQEGIDYAE